MADTRTGRTPNMPRIGDLFNSAWKGDSAAVLEIDSLLAEAKPRARSWLYYYAKKGCPEAIDRVIQMARAGDPSVRPIVVQWAKERQPDSAELWMIWLRDGDEHAAKALLDITNRVSKAVIARTRGTLDPHAIDDLAQHVCVEILKMLKSGRYRYSKADHYMSLLRKIAERAAARELRKQMQIQGRISKEHLRGYLSQLQSLVEEIGRDFEIEHAALRDEFDGASDIDRRLLLMRASGMKFREIAETLNMPFGTTYGRWVTFRRRVLDRWRRDAR